MHNLHKYNHLLNIEGVFYFTKYLLSLLKILFKNSFKIVLFLLQFIFYVFWYNKTNYDCYTYWLSEI